MDNFQVVEVATEWNFDFVYTYVGYDVRVFVRRFDHPVGVHDEVFIHVGSGSTFCDVCRQAVMCGVPICSTAWVDETQVLVMQVVDEVFG